MGVEGVVDPNVIIYALLWTGTIAAVLDAWLEYRPMRWSSVPSFSATSSRSSPGRSSPGEMVVCPVLLDDLEQVLARPKFSWIGEEIVQALLERLRS